MQGVRAKDGTFIEFPCQDTWKVWSDEVDKAMRRPFGPIKHVHGNGSAEQFLVRNDELVYYGPGGGVCNMPSLPPPGISWDDIVASAQPGVKNMSTLRVPLPPTDDQPRRMEPRPDNVGLQDGMLLYYRSQIPMTDAHESERLAKEYFDCRDMLGTEKK